MALVAIKNIEVLDNPAPFTNPFQFEITFECLPPGVTEELEWKLIYVGCASDESRDQELDSVLVGPVNVGTNKFVFQAPAPDPALIPNNDLMEVTVILITCSYKEQEFVRVGYYVNNDYGDNQHLKENPPTTVSIPHLYRNILADQPRLTRFQIRWDNSDPNQPGEAGMGMGVGAGNLSGVAGMQLPTNGYIDGVEGEDGLADMEDDALMDEEEDDYEGDEEGDEDRDLEDEEDLTGSDQDKENLPTSINVNMQRPHTHAVQQQELKLGASHDVNGNGANFGMRAVS